MHKSLFLLIVIFFSKSTSLLSQVNYEVRVKCGTQAFTSDVIAKQKNTAQIQSAFSYISPSGKFIIHYERVGRNAVPLVDVLGGANGIPDYVEITALSADESYKAILSYGFPDALDSSTEPYPIYYQNFQTAYGVMEETISSPHGTRIGINNALGGFNPSLSISELIQVTVAHELKHTFQYRQTKLRANIESTNWREYDAALMEDVVYDSANDFYLFLNTSRSIFNSPDVPAAPLNSSNSEISKGYYKLTFNHYFYEKFGIQFWVDVWAKIEVQNTKTMKDAMSETLEERGTNWETEFNRMFLWHSATQSDMDYHYGFEESIHFPEVKKRYAVGNINDVQTQNTTLSNKVLRPTSADFYQVNAPLLGDYYLISIDNEEVKEFLELGILIYKSDKSVEEHTLSGFTDKFLVIETKSDIDKIEFVVTNSSMTEVSTYNLLAGDAENFDLFIWGDLNNDGLVNMEDLDLMFDRISSKNIDNRYKYDLSGDARITVFDSSLLLDNILGIEPIFKQIDSNANGFGPDAGWFIKKTPVVDTLIIYNSINKLSNGYKFFSEGFSRSQRSFSINLKFKDVTGVDYISPVEETTDIHYFNKELNQENNSISYQLVSPYKFTLTDFGSVIQNSDLQNLESILIEVDNDTYKLSNFDFVITSVYDTADENNTPTQISLNQNFPNPFNPTTQIGFELPQSANVNLVVLNSVGQQVATLAQGPYTAGAHTVSFDATGLASGVYIYILQANSTRILKKMTILK